MTGDWGGTLRGRVRAEQVPRHGGRKAHGHVRVFRRACSPGSGLDHEDLRPRVSQEKTL